MLSKSVVLFALVATALASPWHRKTSSINKSNSVTKVDTNKESQCDTGPVQCCNSQQSADSASPAQLSSLVGVAASLLTGSIGFGCTPLSVLAISQGSSCASEPVCCSHNNIHGGLIAAGCTPINLGL